MSNANHTVHHSPELLGTEVPEYPRHPLLDVDIRSIPSPALARLVDEVRNYDNPARTYNRTYHRHNR